MTIRLKLGTKFPTQYLPVGPSYPVASYPLFLAKYEEYHGALESSGNQQTQDGLS